MEYVGPRTFSVLYPSKGLKDETPNKILGRRVVLYDGPASSFANSWTNPWFVWWNNPFIRSILERFAFFKCDLEIEIVLNSDPGMYGVIPITWEPMIDGSMGAVPGYALYSSQNLIFMDVASRDAVKFIMPWMFQVMYLSADEPGSWPIVPVDGAAFGSSIIAGGTTYTDSVSGYGVIGITAFIRALNVVLEGPKLPASIPPPLQKRAIMQMDNRAIVPSLGAFGALYSFNSLFRDATGSSLVTGLGQALGLAQNANNAAKEINSFASTAQTLKNNVNKLFKDEHTQNETKPVVPGLARLDPYGDVSCFNYVSGYGMGPDNPVAVDPVWDFYSPQMCGDIARIPSYLLPFSMSSTSYSTNPLVFRTPVGCLVGLNQSWGANHMLDIARLFRFWRGAIKFSVSFYTSPMVKSRFRISVYWNTQDVPEAIDDSNLSEAVSEFVTVSGTSHHVFQVPYISKYQWLQTQNSAAYNFPTFEIMCVNQPTAMTSSGIGTIFIVVGIFGGDDLDFASPQDPLGSLVPPVASKKKARASMQMDTRTIAVMEPVTFYAHHIRKRTWCDMSVMDILNRYSTTDWDDDAGITVPKVIPPTARELVFSGKNGHWGYICSLFRFWTGSWRVKAVQKSPPTNPRVSVAMSGTLSGTLTGTTYVPSLGNGCVITTAQNGETTGNIIDIEIPYLNVTPFSTTYNTVLGYSYGPPLGFNENALPITVAYVAAGSTTKLMYLAPALWTYNMPTYPTVG